MTQLSKSSKATFKEIPETMLLTISLYSDVSTNSFRKFCVPKLVIPKYLYQEHDQITQQAACKSLGKFQTIIATESTLE